MLVQLPVRLRARGPARTAGRPGPTVPMLALGAVATALVMTLTPALALAQAGCEGEAITIQTVNTLLATTWTYLTSGAFLRILAVASLLTGIFQLFSGHLVAAGAGLLTNTVTAVLPGILETLSHIGSIALPLCS